MRIAIKELVVAAHIGTTEEERKEAQRLVINVSYRVVGFASESAIKFLLSSGEEYRAGGAVCYDALCASIRDYVSRLKSWLLLETFTAELFRYIVTNFPAIEGIRLCVRKYPEIEGLSGGVECLIEE